MRARRLAVMLVAVLVGMGVAPPPVFADSIRDRQWHLKVLDIAAAHRITQGDGVIVAVADSGVDPRSVEMRSAVIPGITTAGNETGDGREDGGGHGTAMASLIGARGKGGDGGALGIAPKSSIMPIRVTLTGFAGAPDDLAEGIEWAIDHGADVISISLITSDFQPLRAAVERAVKADVVVVAGVGNTPESSAVEIPAKLPGVLAVGGTDQQGNHATVSVRGPEVMITAPAVDLLSIGLDSRYLTATGTSNATAITAGAVALVRAKYPQLSGPEVVRRLTYTAQDKGTPGRDDQYGYGVLDIVKALTADVPAAASAVAGGGGTPVAGGPGNDRNGGSIVVIGVVAIVGVVIVAAVVLVRRRWVR